MKRTFKAAMALLLVAATFAGFCVPSAAAEPRLAHCDFATYSFGILSNGEAHVAVSYSANRATFTQAKLTVRIERQIGLFIWMLVDLGEDVGDQWISTSTDYEGDFYGIFTMPQKGTYRAVIKLQCYGTTDVVDTIEETLTDTYE